MAEVLIGIIGILLFAALALVIVTMMPIGSLWFLAKLAAGIILAVAAFFGGWSALESLVASIRDRRRLIRKETARRAEMRRPVVIAKCHAPHLTHDVERAMASIEAFRSVSRDSTLPLAIEAATLIDQRMPSVIERYMEASTAASTDEIGTIAIRTLGSVIAIADVAEQARAAISRERMDALEIETRFVDGKTAPYGRSEDLSAIE